MGIGTKSTSLEAMRLEPKKIQLLFLRINVISANLKQLLLIQLICQMFHLIIHMSIQQLKSNQKLYNLIVEIAGRVI